MSKEIKINQIKDRLQQLFEIYFYFYDGNKIKKNKICIDHLSKHFSFKVSLNNTILLNDAYFELIYKDGTKEIIDYIEDYKEEVIIKQN